MGRHSNDAGRGGRVGGQLALGAFLLVLLVGGTVGVVRPGFLRDAAGWRPWSQAASQGCPAATVALVVSPELLRAVQDATALVDGRPLPDGRCLRVDVRSQSARDVVAGAAAVPISRAPELWIPDSSLWAAQVPSWPVEPAARFASSPVVLATSEAAVEQLNWASKPPSWAVATGGVRPLAIPNFDANAAGLVAMISLWQSLGSGAAAERAVAAAVLAASRAQAPTAEAALEAATRNEAGAPLLLTSELNVFSTNRDSRGSRLVAVYPRDGEPSLDYPILQVAPDRWNTGQAQAVRTVVGALTADEAGDIVRRLGLRDVN